ncbi:uncharacterized protein LOC112687105 isoform X2 [Sipha flava]|uniref:Uncharacterized protein LOC112687105 isoform X2 n=1 Tax=Sipha flava TaxID=143950 RepID=A0A8B8FYL6_9HEMI|nr:uncharacterized protein LOC112687105 isoform X2 [Sipha flava]
MDLLIAEMEKLLNLDKEKCDIQGITDEYAGKNIDDLLIEADKIISETLPYFQTSSSLNKVKSSKDFNDIKMSPINKTIANKNNQNDTKKVVFNLKNNFHKVQEQTSEISGKITINKYVIDKEKKKSIGSSSLKNCASLEFELKNKELEKNLKLKEEEIRNWEIRYQQLNQYCEMFLKRNIEDTLNSYGYQLNELIDRNMTRESELRNIISNLLEEIEQSHLHYRLKLSEKNEQIRKYLDYIQRILNSVYEFRNKNIKR